MGALHKNSTWLLLLKECHQTVLRHAKSSRHQTKAVSTKEINAMNMEYCVMLRTQQCVMRKRMWKMRESVRSVSKRNVDLQQNREMFFIFLGQSANYLFFLSRDPPLLVRFFAVWNIPLHSSQRHLLTSSSNFSSPLCNCYSGCQGWVASCNCINRFWMVALTFTTFIPLTRLES